MPTGGRPTHVIAAGALTGDRWSEGQGWHRVTPPANPTQEDRIRSLEARVADLEAALRRCHRPAVERGSMKRPTYAELRDGLERALEHLDWCGWGDAWERECSEDLRRELPALLERAKAKPVRKHSRRAQRSR